MITAMSPECKDACLQVTARDAVLVATAQPITKDLADSVAHTAAIHSKSFAKRRSATLHHMSCSTTADFGLLLSYYDAQQRQDLQEVGRRLSFFPPKSLALSSYCGRDDADCSIFGICGEGIVIDS